MIVKKLNKNQYLLRIEPNEEVFESLINFAENNKIKFGFFYGIGACRECEIGRYNEKKKDYDWFKFKKQLEISSLIGNLTLKEGHLYLHIHASLGDKNLKTISGHLRKLVIFPTCEIMFFAFNSKIERKYDQLTNLFLIE
jgi:predicted DNA-binding protein with PD1-like motif